MTFRQATSQPAAPPLPKPTGAAERCEIGIIGGSGMYNMKGLTNQTKWEPKLTMYGKPSDSYTIGTTVFVNY